METKTHRRLVQRPPKQTKEHPSDDRHRPQVPYGLLAVVGVALTAVLIVASQHSSLDRDAGVFAYSGWRMLHGDLPLRDIWDHKPPGIYALDAAAIALFGNTYRAIALLDIALAVAIGVSTLWALRPVVSVPVRAGIALFVLCFAYRADRYAGMNFTEYPALLLSLLSYGSILRGSPFTTNRVWPIVAALLAGTAALFKPSALAPGFSVLLLGLATPLVVRSRERVGLRARLGHLTAIATALLMPTVAIVVVYSAAGGLRELIDTNVTYNGLYAPPLEVASLVVRTMTAPVRADLLVPLAFLTIAVIILGRSDRALVLLASSAVLLESAFVAIQGREYAHYYVLTVGGGALAVAVGFRALTTIRAPWTGLASLVGVAGAVALLLPAVPGLSLRATEQTLAGDYAVPGIVGELRATCAPDESVYVWGAETQINYFSERRSPSRYVYLYPLQMPGFDVEDRADELLSDLQQEHPCAIVEQAGGNPLIPPLDPVARSSWAPLASHEHGAYSADPTPPILAWIDEHYVARSSADPAWTFLVPR